MSGQIRINDSISTGGQPSIEILQSFCDSGFRAIINLRTQHEAD